MSQHDFEIANQGFPSFRSDLNSGLQALASNSAGATEPSTTYAYQFWYDSTANLLKMRNTDNDAWITLAYFDQTNDEWEIRSAVIQAVDSAGVVIKTDDGTTRIEIADDGSVTINTSLDVDNIKIDGNTISSTDTNGDINITPDGTGKVVIDGLNYPTADGSDGQVLTTDGSGNIAFEDAPSGKVLQVVAANDILTATNTNSTSFVATTLAATITPTSASSKILVIATFSATQDGGSNIQSSATIYRGASNLRGSGTPLFMYDHAGGNVGFSGTYMFYDSPATTSATTYTVYVKVANSSSFFRAVSGTDTITLLEIA